MSEFEKAIHFVLEHEGGFVDHPNDPGGATNYGISLRLMKHEPELGDIDFDGDVDVEDIRSLTVEQAANIYRELFWNRYPYGKIESQSVATKVFDLAVNMGARQAHKILQRALNSAGRTEIVVDGVFGEKTLYAVDRVGEDHLLAALCTEAASFYQNLAKRRPTLATFLNGWLRRANDLP